jgi:hypothetical protein
MAESRHRRRCPCSATSPGCWAAAPGSRAFGRQWWRCVCTPRWESLPREGNSVSWAARPKGKGRARRRRRFSAEKEKINLFVKNLECIQKLLGNTTDRHARYCGSPLQLQLTFTELKRRHGSRRLRSTSGSCCPAGTFRCPFCSCCCCWLATAATAAVAADADGGIEPFLLRLAPPANSNILRFSSVRS